jgi:hypothetical protein
MHERGSFVTISLIYQLESFNSCFARCNVLQSRESKTRQERNDWPVQGTRWKDQLTQTSWNMFLRAFKCS